MDILWISYIAFLGLILGSFYNVVGIRLPQKETLLGRSHCPSCQKKLNWYELIPVFGYIFLRGKCKDCGSRISLLYPIIETITALIFVFSFIYLKENVVEFLVVVVFASLMIIVTVSDIYYREVPDIILLIFLPILLVLRFLSPMPWYEFVIGGIIGFGFMYAIALYGRWRFKKDALGGGDIKLYLLVGIFLGYRYVFLSPLFASLLGLLYSIITKNKSGYVPFVPFIFAGVVLTYLFGVDIFNWYIGLFI